MQQFLGQESQLGLGRGGGGLGARSISALDICC